MLYSFLIKLRIIIIHLSMEIKNQNSLIIKKCNTFLTNKENLLKYIKTHFKGCQPDN